MYLLVYYFSQGNHKHVKEYFKVLNQIGAGVKYSRKNTFKKKSTTKSDTSKKINNKNQKNRSKNQSKITKITYFYF